MEAVVDMAERLCNHCWMDGFVCSQKFERCMKIPLDIHHTGKREFENYSAHLFTLMQVPYCCILI